MILLNMVATAYTLAQDASLNRFCSRNLLLVRNAFCSRCDERQLTRNAGQNAKNVLHQRFSTYFQTDNVTLSYTLPYYLSHLESQVRYTRTSVPESEYSTSEQDTFGPEFTAIIDHNEMTILDSQTIYSHIMGIIQRHVSDTNLLIQMLKSTGFLSKVTLRVKGPQANSMPLLRDYHVVKLYWSDGASP